MKSPEKSSKIELEQEEGGPKQVEVVGFDKIDLQKLGFRETEINAEDIFKKAIEILPSGFDWGNIEKIEYKDELKSASDKYGIKTRSSIRFNPKQKSIIFYKKIKEMEKRHIEGFHFKLTHECAHTMDPRVIKQKNLSSDDCREMLIQWERVRKKEQSFSSYVKEIKNKDKLKEDRMKSEEDFAESISMALCDIELLKDKNPERYEFCAYWLKKRFPEYDAQKIAQKVEEYHSLLDSIKQESGKN